ncbi:hypothetical protein SCACP_39120 [Sporomusa carbonis]|uniref:type I-B CRISPR-associated protein Cas5b n=1 Tax=Sporomusa carbonis TaxID=3076075 RepID=UPI003A7ABA02
MKVLRVTAEGLTTSFRYPHFMLGIQPTFEMPPPATIYGHICSAIGEWIDPEEVLFAYHFTHEGKFDDVEHIHVLAAAGGKLPGTVMPKVLEGAVNPYKRTIFFKPKLVLYINKPEWLQYFYSPRYPVALGRSQDLFTYTDIQIVDLCKKEDAYFEHTLAPYEFSMKTARGYSVLMPRFLDYSKGRAPTFERYVVLNQRIHTTDSQEFLKVAAEQYWVDASMPVNKGVNLGLLFHGFTGGRGGK